MSQRNYNPQRVNQAREQIINHVPLSLVVSRYGINIYRDKIVCPFHDDDNPSCFVSDELKTYHCFGCHAKGTVVEFVRDYERLYGENNQYSQVQAIQRLATDYEIEIPDLEDKALIKPERKVRKKRAKDVHRIIDKRLGQYEQQARGVQDIQKRLRIYTILDQYYIGKIQGEEAIKEIRGELIKDE